MKNYELNIQELAGNDEEPKVALMVLSEGQEISRCEARLFSEDDMIAASNQIVSVGDGNSADIDQIISGLIEPIRMRWLRAQEAGDQDPGPAQDVPQQEDANESQARYVAILPGVDGNEGSREASMRDLVANQVLSNFVLIFNEQIEMKDDIESWQEYGGLLTIFERSVPFRIKATDYADNNKLKGALFQAGGCELVIHCSMDELRRAVSTLSRQSGQMRRRQLTCNFGWTEDRSAYLTPGLRISKYGIELVNDETDLRVELSGESPACYLDMKVLNGIELKRVKKHIVDDLLKLNDGFVMHTLLGATAAAVLYPFTKGVGRFSLWLVGQTGGGKSFAAKLFMNFFGNFPIASAPFTTWSATPNYVQRQGYFFKDAMYLVDDYKPEIIGNPSQFLRVLQTYADNTARGRLNANSTANVVRPIRGLLTCTGEDVPEHNASAIARSIIVKLPQKAKALDAGRRCKNECENYSGVMADFIRWLSAENKTVVFTKRFDDLQVRFYSDVVGQQNEIRIASNLAQLGAAFELFAEYLSDVWPEWKEAVQAFVEVDLVAIRDAMLGEAKEQQTSEIFLRTLGDLINYNHVRIEGLNQANAENKPIVGRIGRSRTASSGGPQSDVGLLELSMSLALGAVNTSLRQQSRPELRATESAILTQLREDGKLFDPNGQRIGAGDELTRRSRFEGRQRRVFTLSRSELLGVGNRQ